MQNIATLKNIVNEKTPFPMRNVCGVFEKLPLNDQRIAEGGLRVDGKYKKNSDDKPLVTFITVVRNNRATLKKCMESVWQQTYENIEYIIIDGASDDGTLDIIKNHGQFIDYYVSEPDKGIYNAMNKALSVASGQLINLINSDDWSDPDAAREAVEIYKQTNFDFLAGKGKVYNQDGSVAFEWLPRDIKLGSIFFGVPMLHQAIFATAKCYEAVGGFDETYYIAADFKWIMKVFEYKLITSKTDSLLANFVLGGASANTKKDLLERLRLIKEFFPALNEDNACKLYEELDVTMFWKNLHKAKDYSAISDIISIYKNDSNLLRAINEALLMNYNELYQLYDRQTSQPKIKNITRVFNWLKKM